MAREPRKIALIGGHGKVAMLAAPKLVAAGHQVTSIIRNPDHAEEVADTGATPSVADVETMDVAALTELLRGHDTVIWSAGAGGGNPARTKAVDEDAAIASMQAADAAGVSRYVMVSYYGVGAPGHPHGVPSDNPFFAYAEAKTAADAHLRETDLQWTILKPSRLTRTPSTGTLDPAPQASGDTSRELVADVIIAVVGAPVELVRGRELEFTDGETPIAAALLGPS